MADHEPEKNLRRKLIQGNFMLYEDQIEWLKESGPSKASAFLRAVLDDYRQKKATESNETPLPVEETDENMAEPTVKEWVGIGEAATLKKVHRQTIRDAIKRNELDAYQSGGVWLVSVASLNSYTPMEGKRKLNKS